MIKIEEHKIYVNGNYKDTQYTVRLQNDEGYTIQCLFNISEQDLADLRAELTK